MFLIAGLLLLFVLRHLLVQVIVALVGILGLVIAFLLIIIGLALMFGRPWIRGQFRRYAVAG